MEENNVTLVDQKLEPTEVEVTSIDAQGNYEKRTDTVMIPVVEGLKQYQAGIEEKLAEARKENTDVQQLDKVLNSDHPEDVEVVKPGNVAEVLSDDQYKTSFDKFISGFGYKEVSDILKVYDAMKKDEHYNVLKNLPPLTKEYVKSEMAKDKINANDTSKVNLYARVKVEDIVNQLEVDKAFDNFKKELNEAFQGKDCFEDLFNEERTRIIEYYDKMAQSYEKSANDIDNPNEQNTYTAAKSQPETDISITSSTINYENTSGEYANTETKVETAVPFNVNLKYSTDSKQCHDQAAKLRDCIQGYKDALNYNLLVEYVKADSIEANRLHDGGKYIKRLDRFITEYNSLMTKYHMESTEPIKDSLTKLAKTFQVSYDVVARAFIILVLRIRNIPEGPAKMHYAYYGFQSMKRFHRMDINNIQTEYVKDLVNLFTKSILEISNICNASLNV